jgi:hypothetical protein
METISKQYISNNRDKTSYTSIFKHYYDKSDRKMEKEGNIHALLDIKAEKNVNVERISKFVWDSIVDGYLYSISTTTNESLKDSIKSGVEKVKELIKHDKELEETGIDVSFTIVLVKKEGIYVGTFGEGDILTFKKGKIVNISSILDEKKANTAGVPLEKEDILLVASSGVLHENIPKLSRISKKEDLLKFLSEVGTNLTGTKSLIYFSQAEKAEKGEKTPAVEKERKAEKEGSPSPVVATMKEGAEKIFKPIARVEKIKKPKGQTTLQDLSNKINAKERFDKVVSFWDKIAQKVKPFFKKASIAISEKWEVLRTNISNRFGRKKWYKKIAAKWSTFGGRKRKPVGVQGMRIDGYKEKDLRGKRFKLLGMFIVIVILLALGINFTIRMREAREISRLAQESFVGIEDLIGKVEDNFAVDRTSAETFLFQAERVLEEVPKELNEADQEEYERIRGRLLELGDTLYKRVGVVEKDARLGSYLDARLAFGEGSDVTDLTIYGDRFGNEFLVAADLGRKTIYRVSLYDKSVRAIPDNEGLVKEPAFVYIGNSGIYIYDEREGVLKAPFDDEGWVTSFVKLSGLGVGDVRSTELSTMTVWTDNDNVYFLSRDRGAFLRSTAAYGTSYGLPYEYFSHEKMDIATDMVADISIYFIVPEEPHVIRFNYSFFEAKYVEAPLGTVGFDGNYGKLTKAFTGGTLDNPLYVFDSQGRRFLQLQKPIEAGSDIRHPDQLSLLNQYIYRGERESVWKDVRNFVVDNAESSMYILDGSVIWKLVL